MLYTPAEGVRDAIAECAAARIPTIVAVAEYVPVHDAIEAAARARAAGSWLVGPNTLGIYVPGRGLIGSIAPSFCRPGPRRHDRAQRHAVARHGAAAHARRESGRRSLPISAATR